MSVLKYLRYCLFDLFKINDNAEIHIVFLIMFPDFVGMSGNTNYLRHCLFHFLCLYVFILFFPQIFSIRLRASSLFSASSITFML